MKKVSLLLCIVLIGCNTGNKKRVNGHANILNPKVSFSMDNLGPYFSSNSGLMTNNKTIIFRFIESDCTGCNINSYKALDNILKVSNSENIVIFTKFRNPTDEHFFSNEYNNISKIFHTHDTLIFYNDIPIKSTCFILTNSHFEIIDYFFPEFENSDNFLSNFSQ